ncbi:chromosome partitioning protein parB [Neoasaia chiangmaiensis NBRC 101099]|uniref:ParB-like N-terminal domain-containing protein n=1 Tax=Neoasaia chiangmaiensis TaxID=320497 RepID=A0A1U9KLH8_9PROT|nr:hypothetical protein A0U93_00190 [Neoasaia chiangmaiensis]GBR37233.1 chromosome partitioning protein parB [Neoasaia chiangmaiensis NBRC 101099]GEN16456.1 hypothetical protein NCH01_28870 [Neoasaia chiangmaiensis]
MATAIPKITLSSSRDIPFNRLVLSQSNVRRVKSGLSIEELARDIERRGLLQSLNVRPVLDDTGAETGTYEVPAGGRRFRALELLVKQKKLAKTAPVPCVVREAGSAILVEDDSLAENVQRVALHPLDQFRALSPAQGRVRPAAVMPATLSRIVWVQPMNSSPKTVGAAPAGERVNSLTFSRSSRLCKDRLTAD